MKKIFLALTALLLSAVFIVGCSVSPSENSLQTSVSTETSAESTEKTSQAVSTTAEPTTEVTAAPTTDSVEYAPITENKPSQDLPEESTETITRPTRPSTPTATGDEPAKDPTSDKRYKYIAFTFDDGPHWSLTYKFANKLAEYGGVGTFYVVGNRVYGDMANAMKYAYDLGNEIGVHAYTHEYYYTSCSDSKFYSELSKTADAIYKYTGEYPLTMRPPGGMITQSRVKSSGFAVINWNVDSADWQNVFKGESGRQRIVDNVLRSVDEGDIILMHEIYEDSYIAFCEIIDTLYKRGYRFVTVSQLLGLNESSVGKIYYGH